MSDKHKLKGSFYLKLPTFRDADGWLEIGEVSFGNFYSYGGLTSLQQYLRMCEGKPSLIDQVLIKDDNGKDYSAEEFVLVLSELQVIDNG